MKKIENRAVVCLLLVRAAGKIAGTFMELGDGSK